MAAGHARASIADAAECSSCRLRGRRGTIRCVAANFASYLRVYEPLTAFDRDRQVYWRRYVKDGRAITPADGPIHPPIERRFHSRSPDAIRSTGFSRPSQSPHWTLPGMD